MAQFPTSLTQLSLPQLSHNTFAISSALRAADHIAATRLRSINHDSEFVQRLAVEHGLPLVANERCGLWYVPPDSLTASGYFKSTDGHHGEWRFSARRLNLHLLEVIGKSGGCIVVDSTTRGKSMPDALSKTIPIWCCVLNNLLFPQSSTAALNSATATKSAEISDHNKSEAPIHHPLQTPPDIISQTEQSQILAKLPILIRQARTLNLDLPHLCAILNNKPLRLCFTTPDHPLDPSSLKHLPQDDARNDNIILCCSASHHTTSPFEGYVQGAGDDSENWAHGLTPQVFWKRKDELMHAAEEGEWALVNAIEELVAEEQTPARVMGNGLERQRIMPTQLGTSKLYVGLTPSAGGVMTGFDTVVVCTDTRPSDDEIIHTIQQQTDPRTRILRLPCGRGKNGSRALRSLLPRLIPFIESTDSPISHILVACETGGDLSVGVALALSCLYNDDGGNWQRQRRQVDKTLISQRFAAIALAMPEARPSRATMQSVKAFLMPGKPEG